MAAFSYPCYWIKRKLSGGWYWIYCDSAGTVIARSSETFDSYDACRRSVDVMKGSSHHAVYYSS